MKAVVLAGGKGTRMKPLTHTKSKHLLKIANKPILIHSLEYLKKCGIDEFLVITSNEAYDAVYDTLEKNDSVEVDNVIIQYEPKGIAQALSLAEDWVGEEDFVLYLGDNLFEDVVSLSGGNKIYLKKVVDPKRFGVARFLDERGILLEVVEKPHTPPSNYAVTGMYCFTGNVFSHIDKLERSPRGELEITDLINILIKEDTFDYEFLYGWWLDTGKKDSLLEANQKLLEQISGCIETEDYICVGEGYYKLIKNEIYGESKLRGPCMVSKKANIEGSNIGPNASVDHNTTVTKSNIINSIIGENCSIYNKFLESSIIGSSVRVCSIDKQRTKSIIVVGDDSEVIC